jgi:hypothetical protein
MNNRTATFRLAKETKGTLMFEELDSQGEPTVDLMGNVYVRKSAFAGKKPDKITVAVSFE